MSFFSLAMGLTDLSLQLYRYRSVLPKALFLQLLVVLDKRTKRSFLSKVLSTLDRVLTKVSGHFQSCTVFEKSSGALETFPTCLKLSLCG